MTLQPVLLDAVRGGRVILFLGAGASRGAAKPGGAQIPGAPELAKRIVSDFLGPDYEGASFRSAYDLAASDRSVRELQGFIHRELFEYQPADFHLLLPGFVWAGLATTNYDLIIERAYERCTGAQQEPIPYCKDGDGATDRLGSGRVLYVKLHGCITHYQEINPPLIANTEQIINHREGQAGQFAQFLEWSQTKTIVFAGYAMDDSNLRTLLEEIRKEGDNRPRHYIVRPGIRDKEERYWRDRRIEPISLTFEQFLRELDKAIPADRRRLSLLPASFSASPFTRFIARANVTESARLCNYLRSQCEHVSKETTSGAGDPKRFYNGFDLGWYPMAENLDVSRRVTAAVFDEWIVSTQAIASTQAVIVKAHAGAGKSVILRRLAWDAAHRLDRLVFFLEHAGAIDFDAIEEIVSLTKQTVYFIIDDVAESPESALQLLRRGKAQRWPLVLISGARVNEWNIRCDELEPFVDATYEIGYLSHAEIDDLLGRLERHECLGHLATLPFEERRKQLREIYGRQLLVALHEATKNDSFRNIIHDEFQNIFPREAQILYLDICALHRFGPPVRAGLNPLRGGARER
jgi:SIR2-like domain